MGPAGPDTQGAFGNPTIPEDKVRLEPLQRIRWWRFRRRVVEVLAGAGEAAVAAGPDSAAALSVALRESKP